MERTGIRVEPGLPPFDPETGDVTPQPLARQTEIVLEQMIEIDCIAVT